MYPFILSSGSTLKTIFFNSQTSLRGFLFINTVQRTTSYFSLDTKNSFRYLEWYWSTAKCCLTEAHLKNVAFITFYIHKHTIKWPILLLTVSVELVLKTSFGQATLEIGQSWKQPFHKRNYNYYNCFFCKSKT